MHVSAAFETLNASLSVASGGDEEKVCFYLKVLHSWRACKRCSSSAVSCVCVCLRVLKRIRVYVSLCLHAGAHTYSKGLLCVHVCICARLCVSPLAWRSLYRPEQNSLVESSYQSHVRGGEEGEGERR